MVEQFLSLNSLYTKKADDKIFVNKISKKKKKKIIPAISYLELKNYRANSVDLDEMAHFEPPHQELRCLRIQLFLSLVLKELRVDSYSVEGRQLL